MNQAQQRKWKIHENAHQPIKRDKCFAIKINIIIKKNFTVIPSIFDNHNIKNVCFQFFFFLFSLSTFLGVKTKGNKKKWEKKKVFHSLDSSNTTTK